MNLQDNFFKDERIVIDEAKFFNTLGKDVVLQRCELIVKVPASMLSLRCKMINTTIIAESGLSGFSWLEASVSGCKFLGVFKGNEFGCLRNSCDKGCRDCDFTESSIENCLFYGPFSDSHKFPVWPNFVILNPHNSLNKMKNSSAIISITDSFDFIEFLDEEVSAVALNAYSLAAKSGRDIEVFRKFFSQFSFIILNTS